MNKIYTGLLLSFFILTLFSCKSDDEQSISECTEGIWLLIESCELNAQGQTINCETSADDCPGAPAETNHWNFKDNGTIISNYQDCDDDNNHLCISYDEGNWFYTEDKLTITYTRYYDCKDEEFVPFVFSPAGDATCNDNELILIATDGSDTYKVKLVRP